MDAYLKLLSHARYLEALFKECPQVNSGCVLEAEQTRKVANHALDIYDRSCAR